MSIKRLIANILIESLQENYTITHTLFCYYKTFQEEKCPKK